MRKQSAECLSLGAEPPSGEQLTSVDQDAAVQTRTVIVEVGPSRIVRFWVCYQLYLYKADNKI